MKKKNALPFTSSVPPFVQIAVIAENGGHVLYGLDGEGLVWSRHVFDESDEDDEEKDDRWMCTHSDAMSSES